MNEPHCDCTPDIMGTYKSHISVITPWGETVSVDACMVPELASLWRRGIRTIASCCGHKKACGFVAVKDADCATLDALGYARCVDAPHCHVSKSFPGTPRPVAQDERARFEEWAHNEQNRLVIRDGDGYCDPYLTSGWIAWRACAKSEPAVRDTEDAQRYRMAIKYALPFVWMKTDAAARLGVSPYAGKTTEAEWSAAFDRMTRYVAPTGIAAMGGE